jgi:hypothetical protein
MAHFEELQQLWQQQAETPVTPREAESLAASAHKFGRRQDLINGAKLLLMIVQVVWVVLRNRQDPMKMYGAFVVDLCVVYFLACEWRRQRSAVRLNFAASSVEFLRNAIMRLEALRNPFKGPEFYIMMGGYVVGINFMMHDGNWLQRTIFNALPFIIYYPGVYLRGKRWDHECRPLVARLKELVAAAEENRTWTAR